MRTGSTTRLEWLLRGIAIVLAVLNVAAAIKAESMGEDGINYLDQGDAWWRGDWRLAISGTWSPLYPIVLGLVMRVVRPAVTWEFPLVHVVNLGIFVFALACFGFFWRQVTLRYHDDPALDHVPPWTLLCVGYGLFTWTSVCLISLFALTPDMMVAAFTYLAGGCLLKLVAAPSRQTAIAFGAALGAGYLAKAVMFPLGIVMLGVAGVALWRSRRSPVELVPGIVAFLLLASPLLIPLTVRNGAFTFSEVGRTSYLRHVLRASYPHYEPGSPNVAGEARHPFDKSSTDPVVYRYPGHIGTTFPPAYDQGYWYDGVRARFRPMLQVNAIALNVQRYFELFIRVQGVMLGAALVMLVALRGRRAVPASGAWMLIATAVAALGMYVLVYVEGRYIAPFIVLLWTGVFLVMRLEREGGNSAWFRSAAIAFVAGVVFNIGAFHLDGFNALARIAPVARAGPISRTVRPSARPSTVVQGLQDAGLQRGDSIGVIGEAIAATWARLGRLRIVADVEPEHVATFWAGTPEQQSEVLAAFDAAGVRAVIAEPPPEGNPPPGWLAVGETGFLVRLSSSDAGLRGTPAPTR